MIGVCFPQCSIKSSIEYYNHFIFDPNKFAEYKRRWKKLTSQGKMGLKVNVSAIFLLLFLTSADVKAENVVFDVTKYGDEEDISKVSILQYNV